VAEEVEERCEESRERRCWGLIMPRRRIDEDMQVSIPSKAKGMTMMIQRRGRRIMGPSSSFHVRFSHGRFRTALTQQWGKFAMSLHGQGLEQQHDERPKVAAANILTYTKGN
jgi:hypothetical protein